MLQKDLRNETRLFEVDYLIKITHNAVSYVLAHRMMKELAEKGVFTEHSTVGFSFSETAVLTRSYLQGLAEYVNEYTEITWYARTPSINDASKVLKEMAGENFHVIEEIPYTKIEVVRI